MSLIPIEPSISAQRFGHKYAVGEHRRRDLIALKGGACERCEGKFMYSQYQFHHRNPLTKEFNLTKRELNSKSWASILIEADKTSLLCEPCHVGVHKTKDAKWFDMDFWPYLNQKNYERAVHEHRWNLKMAQSLAQFAGIAPRADYYANNFYKRLNKQKQRLNLLA